MDTQTLKEFHQERLSDKARVAVVNLGCVRNTVDSQTIVHSFERKGHRLSAVDHADIVIVNTCSFIEDARKESVDVILDLLSLKKEGKVRKVVVAGCLAERYGRELAREIPEVDAFVGIQALQRDKLQADPSLTPAHYAYLKICESCFNQCSFCIIPKLKGRFVSRDMEAVLKDARRLDARGAREINIVGQDITAYGLDRGGKKLLAELLGRIARTVKNVDWIRLLYAYPAHITDELLDVIASEPRICQYLDVPFQHVNDRILKAMNRRITKAQTVRLVEKIRRKIPGVFLRTTFIVGFPGETDREFQELLAFIHDHPFERVGVFAYSREEGTAAYDLPQQTPERVKKARVDAIMSAQQKAVESCQEKLVGQVLRILIEEPKKDAKNIFIGRSQYDAPDVDGIVYVKSRRRLRPGQFVDAKIGQALGYDLEGEEA